ncbi:MAG: alpha/beta fold hydrolase [Syntrophobacteraceae bacterium]
MAMTALLCLVRFLLLVSICASLATYFLFWYENAWSARFAPDGGTKPRLMVLSGLLSSIVSLTFIVVSYPFGLFRRFWEPKEISASEPVIILTHGLYHNASAWLLFRSILRKAGFKNVFVMNYGSFFTSFEKTLKKFERFVADARNVVPNQPVYLIGHSLGGLLSRVYAERARDEAIPAAVITIGSPHQGSKVAAFSLGKLAKSLLYRGPLFTELECGTPRLPCSGIALFSPVDNIVLPSEAMKAPYPGWVYYETGPLSHTAMIYSKSVAKKVVEILQGKEIA